jgi:DNA-binding NarL/FixJ family response regulator
MSGIDPYRIVLADDHTLVRQGVRKILEGQCDFEIVGEACDGLELLNFLKMCQPSPHMVIVDISMPNLSGIEVTRRIREMYPGMKVLILTMHKNKEYVDYAIAAGADGYVLKEDADQMLFSAIKTIRQGRTYLSSLLSESPEIGRR